MNGYNPLAAQWKGGIPHKIGYQTPSYMMPQTSNTGNISPFIGAAGLGLGLFGQFGSLPPGGMDFPEIPMTREDVESVYQDLLGVGQRNIQTQLAAANRAAAARGAQSGLANTGFFARMLGLNEQQAGEMQQALEVRLGREKMDSLMQLAQMEYQRELARYQSEAQRRAAQGDIFGSLADVGGSLLMLALL